MKYIWLGIKDYCRDCWHDWLSNRLHKVQGERKIDEATGKFLCSDPKLNEIKIRLYDKDRQCTKEYTLSKLIYTKFKRNKFEYRGMSTGLKDKNGKLIYEGDLIKSPNNSYMLEVVRMPNGVYGCKVCKISPVWEMNLYSLIKAYDVEIIGNVHTRSEE